MVGSTSTHPAMMLYCDTVVPTSLLSCKYMRPSDWQAVDVLLHPNDKAVARQDI